MNILIDEKSLDYIINNLNQSNSMPFKITDFWIEPGRCLSAKIDYGDISAKIKIQVLSERSMLSFKVFKVFAEGININLSGFISKFSGSINSIISGAKLSSLFSVRNDTLNTKIKIKFAGVTNSKELMIRM
jgi:hypothetical protein